MFDLARRTRRSCAQASYVNAKLYVNTIGAILLYLLNIPIGSCIFIKHVDW